jgi:guanine deaminase
MARVVLLFNPMTQDDFMREAIKLAEDGMHGGRGGPFGCVVVRRGEIVGRGQNRVTSTNDPTAHAEVTAIRDACASLQTFQLTDCELYTSCEPCPMCLSAIYWARIPQIFFANTRQDAAEIGFDDDFIYRQIPLPLEKRAIKIGQILREEGLKTFQGWTRKSDKVRY